MDSPLYIKRETEFYQGYIQFKVSVANASPSIVADVTLDFILDENLLHIADYGGYPVKNGKIMLGNIYGSKSKSIAILFEPLTCAKAADIKCQVNYADHNGNMDTVWMDPKEISVVCPIMETDQDINIGRLKEFIEKLPVKDSRVYEIQSGFNVGNLSSIARKVVEKHDVRHVRTLHTLDGKVHEIWYYGKTKVTKDNIVIKISVVTEHHTMELFAATQSSETLTGLLAEVGRDLKQTVEAKTNGKGGIVNLHIKDSVVQRSSLLDMCDMDGTCDVNVVIEDSVVQRSSIATVKKDKQRELSGNRKNKSQSADFRSSEFSDLAELFESVPNTEKEIIVGLNGIDVHSSSKVLTEETKDSMPVSSTSKKQGSSSTKIFVFVFLMLGAFLLDLMGVNGGFILLGVLLISSIIGSLLS